MTRVFVSSAIANKPNNGGNAWAVFSWVNGLRRLGVETTFVEQISPESCRDSFGNSCAARDSLNAAFFANTCRYFGIEQDSALIAGDDTIGLDRAELVDRASEADLLINITGHLEDTQLLRRVRRRAYLDFDPGYTQFWQASGVAGARLEGHDVFFTLAENINSTGCCIPGAGIEWKTTRQPVVLDDWEVTPGDSTKFTSVATWRPPYGRLQFEGRDFGLKLHEFRKIIETPGRCPDETFELALDIDPGDHTDIELLRSHGWHLVDAIQLSTPEAFRAYVQGSGAELSSAQPVYVETRSGWFSDRSVRYLASGKPVIVQDTGFSDHLPLNDGLFAYRSPDDVVDAVASISADYSRHAASARALAEEYFDSDRIISRFLEEAGVSR